MKKFDATNVRRSYKKHPLLTRIIMFGILLIFPFYVAGLLLWESRKQLASEFKECLACVFLPWEDKNKSE